MWLTVLHSGPQSETKAEMFQMRPQRRETISLPLVHKKFIPKVSIWV